MKKYISLLMAIFIVLAIPMTIMASDDTIMLPSGLKKSDIKSVVDEYVYRNKSTTAAVSIAIFTGDDVLFNKSYGYVDVQNKISNDSESVFEWGSCTKLLVWTSVMQLVEKGEIDLNKDIRAYLPDDFFTKLKYDKPITMENLMNHNAGWQDIASDLFIKDEADVKELGAALRYTEPEQVNEPGTVVSYSNWGAALAGYIVECVSRQSFDKYVDENIFKPLGMEHTAINAKLSDNAWVIEKRAQEKCYTTKGVSLGTCQYYLSLYPAGRATGTMSDFVKFAQAFVPAKGKNSILFKNAGTLDEMLSPSLYFADGKTGRNRHGFWTDEIGVPIIWHNGADNGSTSYFGFDPKSGIGVVILTNQNHESVYTCGILPVIFGKTEKVTNVKEGFDISGMYVSAQTCFKGYAKLYSMACNMQLVTSKMGGYTAPGTNFTFTSIGTGSYLMDMGGMKQYNVYVDTRKDGTKILQLPGKDYIQINGYGVISKFILLLLFLIAVLFNIVALPVNVIRVIRHSKKRPFIGYRIAVNASILVSAAIFGYISVTLFGSAGLFRMIQPGLVLNAFCALVPVAYIIELLIRWRKTDCTKKQKVGLILNGMGGLIMTINVIFWNAFIFW